MRGGMSAIQQTLTPEAASVLTHSIAEAARRNHGQTTPLHVAATLLSSPTSFLRQACIRSHPNSSHPLQCRALELCFSVALERLPTSTTTSSSTTPDPPLSNALMAALKRAQAHQRRGCPEQQQQPLLAVKVELEQLIISILDDPSVSRVMREASFSSPAVKAAIEHSVSTRPAARPGPTHIPRNLYLNPRLQQQQQQQQTLVQQPGGGRGEDVKRVMEILARPRKRNPVLVGESEPKEVIKEVLRNVETHEGVLKGVEVISLEKELLGSGSDRAAKLKELVERKMLGGRGSGGGGVVVDLGDLKWLVEQPNNLEAARAAVAEMGRIIGRFGGEGGRIWVVGTATCETYLRCQVYHPSMESEWDLQVVSIVARPTSNVPGMLPRLGSNGGILSSSVESLSPMKNFPMTASALTRRVSENSDPSRRFNCCPQCTEKCNQEVAKLTAEQAEKSSSPEVASDATRPSLPPWLQNAKLRSSDPLQGKEQDVILRQKTQEVQKKWSDACVQLHPSFHHHGISSERIITPSPLSMTGLYNPALLARTPLQPKLHQQTRSLGDTLQLNISPPLAQPSSPPSSPVRTDLVLGRAKPASQSPQDKAHKERLTGLLNNPVTTTTTTTTTTATTMGSDVDSYKRLLKGLMEKVAWQRDAASRIASAITQCKMGNGKRRANGSSKGDIWLLFSGPDRTGKKKMAAALAELVYGAAAPILISLGSRRYGDESDLNFRGKTAIDRIAEAVRRNPCSVIMLQDIDEADMVVQASMRRAMERGRLSDSHGREISLGNVIFVLTSNWVPDQLKGGYSSSGSVSEEKLTALASGGWQLKISIGENPTTSGKRPPPNWVLDDDDDDDDNDEDRDRSSKQQRKEIGFDLNQVADVEDGSHNSSDLTVEHEEAHAHGNRGSPTSAVPHELLSSVDDAVVFRPVDFAPVRQNVERAITVKFGAIAGDRLPLKIENAALEKILSGLWLGQVGLEAWVDQVLAPSIYQIKTKLLEGNNVVARLELDKESESRAHGDWLPSKISVDAQ